MNYGEQDGENEDKEITEDEWLDKEQKEIEEVEKTVTIRFANYTTLMRAATLTHGLSAQLAMYLTGLAPGGAQAVPGLPKADEAEFTKQLLEKAGLLGEQHNPKPEEEKTKDTKDPIVINQTPARSLSPTLEQQSLP